MILLAHRNQSRVRESNENSVGSLQKCSSVIFFSISKKEDFERTSPRDSSQLLFYNYVITADLNSNDNEFIPRFDPRTQRVA